MLCTRKEMGERLVVSGFRETRCHTSSTNAVVKPLDHTSIATQYRVYWSHNHGYAGSTKAVAKPLVHTIIVTQIVGYSIYYISALGRLVVCKAIPIGWKREAMLDLRLL